jgi:hypothetical protein
MLLSIKSVTQKESSLRWQAFYFKETPYEEYVKFLEGIKAMKAL